MPPKAAAEAALFAAAEAGSVDKFQQAAAALGDVELKTLHDASGSNALHLAARAGRTELCKWLLEHAHFDINAQDAAGKGSTALSLAIAGGHIATAEALLEHSPDVNRHGEGDAPSPLHLAVAGGHVQLAERLIAAGADVNAASSDGTPLELAAARSNAAAVTLLLGAGAAVDAASRKGVTPLFLATLLGTSPECVQLLVDAGADVNARAMGSFTPLHVAAEGGKTAIAEVLLKAGANPQAKDEHGHTPARVAGMHGHRKLVELLLGRTGEAGGSSSDAGASGSGSGSGAGGSSSAVDDFMASSKDALKEREAKTASTSDGASVVTVPQPEVPDEALADTFKRKGNEMFVAGQYETAAKLYELALSHWTKNPVVWSNRAACFLRLDNYEKALQDAQIARALDPKYVKAWYREGRAAEGLKRWEDAATAYYQAAQLEPSNEEFIRLTKEAILEGRKAYQAQQGQQADSSAAPAGGGAAGGAAAQ
ncbi:hypothetical protein COHA_004298 [Chlorella ohadii]|uniref:Uncharacterized protein n=1 Tax=Chlorella ohadii TaxID=2649997 RepID=A0AAD5H2T3_9CHLO|nr:hypothetical protein COHA_004298 [Chlorella ohadii]